MLKKQAVCLIVLQTFHVNYPTMQGFKKMLMLQAFVAFDEHPLALHPLRVLESICVLWI